MLTLGGKTIKYISIQHGCISFFGMKQLACTTKLHFKKSTHLGNFNLKKYFR